MENNAIKVQMGQAIRRLRKKERLSQERLALMVGISRHVESGKANVSVVVLLKIAESLGVGGGFILAEANLDAQGREELSGTCEGRRTHA